MADDAKTNGEDGENVVATGGNLSKLKAELKKGFKQVIALKAEAREANTEIGEIKAKFAAEGIPKSAFNQALKEYETSQTEDGEEKLREHAEGVWIAREALGLPGQRDMWEGKADAEWEAAKPEPETTGSVDAPA